MHCHAVPTPQIYHASQSRWRLTSTCAKETSLDEWLSAPLGENDEMQKRDSQARTQWPKSTHPNYGKWAKAHGVGRSAANPLFPASPSAGENRFRFPWQQVTHSTRVRVWALNHPAQQHRRFALTFPRIGTSDKRISCMVQCCMS